MINFLKLIYISEWKICFPSDILLKKEEKIEKLNLYLIVIERVFVSARYL